MGGKAVRQGSLAGTQVGDVGSPGSNGIPGYRDKQTVTGGEILNFRGPTR